MGRIREIFTPAPYEKGLKWPVSIAVRRFSMLPAVSPKLPGLMDAIYDPVLFPWVTRQKNQFHQALGQLDPQDAALVDKNTTFTPWIGAYPTPGPAYPEIWLRDVALSLLPIEAPEAKFAALKRFTRMRGFKGKDGHLPTVVYFGGLLGGNRRLYFDDDSTAWGIILRAQLVDEGLSMGKKEKQGWEESVGFVRSHFKDGFYTTKGGKEHGWLDTLILPVDDTYTNTHGIAIASLFAAQRLGIEVKGEEIKQAIDAYNKLSRPSGALKSSRKTDYVDVSSLVGAYLASTLFNAYILDREVVRNTLESFCYCGPNLKVICHPNGDPLDPQLFNPSFGEGRYQNAGSWPLFTAIAEKMRQIAGLGIDKTRLLDEQHQMDLSQNAEWRNGLVFSYKHPEYDPLKINHAWNVLARVLIRQMLAA